MKVDDIILNASKNMIIYVESVRTTFVAIDSMCPYF